jgi:hypothetical protein
VQVASDIASYSFRLWFLPLRRLRWLRLGGVRRGVAASEARHIPCQLPQHRLRRGGGGSIAIALYIAVACSAAESSTHGGVSWPVTGRRAESLNSRPCAGGNFLPARQSRSPRSIDWGLRNGLAARTARQGLLPTHAARRRCSKPTVVVGLHGVVDAAKRHRPGNRTTKPRRWAERAVSVRVTRWDVAVRAVSRRRARHSRAAEPRSGRSRSPRCRSGSGAGRGLPLDVKRSNLDVCLLPRRNSTGEPLLEADRDVALGPGSPKVSAKC